MTTAVATKTCTKCTRDLALSEFPARKRSVDGLDKWCKDCKREYNAAYYERTRHIHNPARAANRKARAKELYEYIYAYLRAHPCVDCGESDPIVLEFDHRGDKLGNVSEFARKGYSMRMLQAEIAKCDIRCANCHRRRTAHQFGWAKLLSGAVEHATQDFG